MGTSSCVAVCPRQVKTVLPVFPRCGLRPPVTPPPTRLSPHPESPIESTGRLARPANRPEPPKVPISRGRVECLPDEPLLYRPPVALCLPLGGSVKQVIHPREGRRLHWQTMEPPRRDPISRGGPELSQLRTCGPMQLDLNPPKAQVPQSSFQLPPHRAFRCRRSLRDTETRYHDDDWEPDTKTKTKRVWNSAGHTPLPGIQAWTASWTSRARQDRVAEPGLECRVNAYKQP
jgi:hypothetical protein